MTDHEFAVAYLKAIERNYKDYFESSGDSIMDSVVILGEELVGVHVTDTKLPPEIRHRIELMFWTG
ncbi:MAG: hypothetical protein M3O71_26720 [Bacteroidota bacterium]|nr:hypothetical protein [Bacteroidota bacterium]